MAVIGQGVVDAVGKEPLDPRKRPEFDCGRQSIPEAQLQRRDQGLSPGPLAFTPRAAATTRDFLFHPTQEMTEDVGGLTVRFTASGWLEMAWHLYLWGEQVEVLAPEALAQMVAAHRRGDFPALP